MAEDKEAKAPEVSEDEGTPAEVEEACECCVTCECLTDEDDLAMGALICGVGAVMFGMFGFTNLHFLALPLGLLAICSGKKALKQETRWQKQAWGGIVCGVIGACAWLLTLGLHAVRALFS